MSLFRSAKSMNGFIRAQGGQCTGELLLPFGRAVLEHGEIAMRDVRLGMRQRLQSASGIGDDRRAVLARNVAMICNTLGVFALDFAARTGRADLVLRLEPEDRKGVG